MEYTSLVPLMNRILVQRMALPPMTAGGILIPVKPDSASKIGKVIAVGKGVPLADGTILKPKVKKGDFVLVNDWAGYKVPPRNSKDKDLLYLYKEEDLLGIVNKYKH